MAADVLLYNALVEQNKQLSSQSAIISSNIAAQNALCTAAEDIIAANKIALISNAGPNQANIWCLIPTLPETGCPWTGDLQVCDASAYFREGVCCAWTVPAGVTCARFQLWGAGAMTGYGCCCAFTPYGGTGAYASVIIPVTAGDTYTLCSGCAYCCCASAGSTGNDADGCPSFVTGPGLTNFCAEGGEASIYCQLLTRGVLGATTCTYCCFLGGKICTNNSVCWDASGGIGAPGNCYDNMFPMISSCKTFYGSATSGSVYGIRGSFASIAVNCDGRIFAQDAPIYGFPSVSCCSCTFISSTAGGWCLAACTNIRRYPGAGGNPVYQSSGDNSYAGDSGRAGMVCVSYL